MKGRENMDVKEAISRRRAYRALEPAEISDETVSEMAEAARLTASCYNNQPWRFVFVRSPGMLKKLHGALSRGNAWAQRASMIVAVFCGRESDCVIKEREYYLFDTGMAVSAMILRATELGLVAHPIAGYDPAAAAGILGIPEDRMLITLIIVGKKSDDLSALNENQLEAETERPERLRPGEVYSTDRYDPSLG